MHLVIFTPIRLFSEALATSLNELPEITDVASCEAPDQVAQIASEVKPDLVLFDVTHDEDLAQARGVAESCPGVTMIALALPELAKDVIACADAGFTAYIPRHASIDELRGLMRMALRGEVGCHPKVVACLLKELRRRSGFHDSHEAEPLTARESEVLHLVGRGLTNKEIARSLNLSVSTIKAHLHNIFAKLHVRGRGEAIALIRRMPWLEHIA